MLWGSSFQGAEREICRMEGDVYEDAALEEGDRSVPIAAVRRGVRIFCLADGPAAHVGRAGGGRAGFGRSRAGAAHCEAHGL